MTHSVIYLTGAPASGKSTLLMRLSSLLPDLFVFQYGAELTSFLSAKRSRAYTQEDLRSESSFLATEDDIRELDQHLLQVVSEQRRYRPVLIDTHAVTKERYGFRVSPFSMEQLIKLGPTRIVVLYASPEVTINRIAANPGGRPTISGFESGFHTGMQASVAISYAIGLGLPVHFLDSDTEVETLANWLQQRISSPGP